MVALTQHLPQQISGFHNGTWSAQGEVERSGCRMISIEIGECNVRFQILQ